MARTLLSARSVSRQEELKTAARKQSRQSHFVTFSCYRRQPAFSSPDRYDLFVQCLEDMRRRFSMCVYGYVVMPEHVHLLVNEPKEVALADAIHYLKLSFAKRLRSRTGRIESRSFWQKRYYDRNVGDAEEFTVKLRYLHRNPVARGLVKGPAEWKWSSFRHYALREAGIVEIESEWTARDREQETQGGSPRIFLNPGWRAKNAREPGAPGTRPVLHRGTKTALCGPPGRPKTTFQARGRSGRTVGGGIDDGKEVQRHGYTVDNIASSKRCAFGSRQSVGRIH